MPREFASQLTSTPLSASQRAGSKGVLVATKAAAALRPLQPTKTPPAPADGAANDSPPELAYSLREPKPATAYRSRPQRARNPHKPPPSRRGGGGGSNAAPLRTTGAVEPDVVDEAPPQQRGRDPAPKLRKIRGPPIVDADGFMIVQKGKPVRVTIAAPVPARFTRPPREPQVFVSTAVPSLEPRLPSRRITFSVPLTPQGLPPRKYHVSLDANPVRTLAGYVNRIRDDVAGVLGNVPDGVRFLGATRPAQGANVKHALMLTDRFRDMAQKSGRPVTAGPYAAPAPRETPPRLPASAAQPSGPSEYTANLIIQDPRMQKRSFKVRAILFYETLEPPSMRGRPAKDDSIYLPAPSYMGPKGSMLRYRQVDVEFFPRIRPINSFALLKVAVVDEVPEYHRHGITYANSFISIAGKDANGVLQRLDPLPPGYKVGGYVTSKTTIVVVRACPERDLTRYGIEPNPGPPWIFILAAMLAPALVRGLIAQYTHFRSNIEVFFQMLNVACAHLTAAQQMLMISYGYRDPMAHPLRFYKLSYEQRVLRILNPPRPFWESPYFIGLVVFLAVSALIALLGTCLHRSFLCIRFTLRPGRPSSETWAPLRRDTLNATVESHCDCPNCPTTSNVSYLWWRLFCGRSSGYSYANVRHSSRYESGVLAERVGASAVLYGKQIFIDQSSSPLSALPLSPTATIRFMLWARHNTIALVPRKAQPGFSCIETVKVTPGPWHYCGRGCVHSSEPFTIPAPTSCRYSEALVTVDGVDTHLSWANHTGHVVVPTALLYDSVNRWALNGKATQYFSIATTMGDHREAVSLIMHAVANGFIIALPPSAHGSTTMLDSYSDSHTVDSEQSIVSVHNPLVSDANFVHGSGPDALTHAISARVHAPPSRQAVTPAHALLMAEFVRIFMGNAPLVRLSIEEVAHEMDKPSQKRELDDMGSVFDVMRSRWTFFSKTEATGPTKPVRVIAASKGPQNYMYAAYIIPMFRHMLSRLRGFRPDHSWCPGASCGDIQERVHRLHARAKILGVGVYEGDFSSFDATTGAYGNTLMYRALCHCFPNDRGWSSLLDHTTGATASNMVGIQEPIYMGIGTYSGSSDTTFRNTLLNLFVHYSAARASGLSCAESEHHIRTGVLVSGDDSLALSTTVSAETIAASYGMTLTGRTYTSGATTFLGRLYPNPYVGGGNIADLRRFLKSFHLISKIQGFSLSESMSQKAFGRLVNDRRTPLLTAYCEAVLRQYPCAGLDARFFDKWSYEALSSGNNYSSGGFSDDELRVAAIENIGIDSTAFALLQKSMETLVPSPGSVYPTLSPVMFKAKPGMVVSGVPVSVGVPLPDRPSVWSEASIRRAEAAAIQDSREAMDAVPFCCPVPDCDCYDGGLEQSRCINNPGHGLADVDCAACCTCDYAIVQERNRALDSVAASMIARGTTPTTPRPSQAPAPPAPAPAPAAEESDVEPSHSEVARVIAEEDADASERDCDDETEAIYERATERAIAEAHDMFSPHAGTYARDDRVPGRNGRRRPAKRRGKASITPESADQRKAGGTSNRAQRRAHLQRPPQPPPPDSRMGGGGGSEEHRAPHRA